MTGLKLQQLHRMHASNKANDDDNVTMRSTNVKVESSTKKLLDSDTTQFQIGFQFDSLNFVQILLVNDQIPPQIPKLLSTVQCKYHLVKCGSGRIGSKMVKLRVRCANI